MVSNQAITGVQQAATSIDQNPPLWVLYWLEQIVHEIFAYSHGREIV